MKRVTKIVGCIAVFVAGLAAVPLVFGHTGQSTVTCTGITFSYLSFSDANNNTVTEKITEDGAVVYSKPFVFNGSSASHVDTLDLTGDHEVEATSSWNTNGAQGSYDSGLVHIVCTSVTTTKTITNNLTTTVTTPSVTVTIPIQTVTVTNTNTVTTPGVTTTVAGPTTTHTNTVTVPGATQTIVVTKKSKPVVRTIVKTKTIYVKSKCKVITPKAICLSSPGGIWKKGHCGFIGEG